MADDETVVVRKFSDEIKAVVARGHLEAAGIQSFILRHDGGLTYTEFVGVPDLRVMVYAPDSEEADKILKAFGC